MKEKQINTTDQTSNEVVIHRTNVFQDLKSSVLILSVFANLVIFTMWVTLQVTSQFDGQFANLLFNR